MLVDPHVMCGAAIGDLDADGADELVLPVSYFFDRAYHDSAEHRGELPEGVDPAMYIASGIVVFDLDKRGLKWNIHLDLTTDHVDLRCAAVLPAGLPPAFAAGASPFGPGAVACRGGQLLVVSYAELAIRVSAARIKLSPGLQGCLR